MRNLNEYIESGIIEAYVFDQLNPGGREDRLQIALHIPEVKQEQLEIEEALEQYAFSHAITPSPNIKPLLLATIDYFESLEKGGVQAIPPDLNVTSLLSDFSQWVEKKDMVAPENFNGMYVKIIGYTPKATTAIVWMKEFAPTEVHHDEYEKFLVLEGSCTVFVENDSYNLVAGNFLSIPLHKEHRVIITSSIPCKVILQRSAA